MFTSINRNMQEELVSFETAILAKEKGFDLNCKEFTLAYYNKNNKEPSKFMYIDLQPSYKESDWYLAPTQSLLQRWLREVHNIQVDIFCDPWINHNTYTPVIMFPPFAKSTALGLNIQEKSYEMCLEKALLEALKLIQ